MWGREKSGKMMVKTTGRERKEDSTNRKREMRGKEDDGSSDAMK